MQRYHLCKRRWLKLALLVSVSLAIYEIYAITSMASCSNKEIQESLYNLCHLFARGEVSGDLCPALCQTNEIVYGTCLNYRDGKRIVDVTYRGSRMILKSKHGYLHEFRDLSIKIENKTVFPEVSDFNKILLDTMKINFEIEIPERRDMLTRLWTIPFHDLKADSQKTAAMRSIWSLVQQDEYLVFRYFENVDSFPRIKGSCGHYYAVEYAPPGDVLNSKALSGDSNWNERREIALKFMDLIVNLDSSLQGNFHLCDVKADNFGLNSNNELKIIDVDMAFFTKRLHEQFELKTCRSDGECRFLDCHGRCDMDRKICRRERINSNLQAICYKVFSHRLTTGYRGLLRYPPSLIKEPLEALLHECSELNTDDPNFSDQLQESVYWKLKNLLKKSFVNQIADYAGF